MTTSEGNSRISSETVESELIDGRLSGGKPHAWLSMLLLFALLWFLLSGDAWASWLVGLPAVALASWSALWLRSSTQRQVNLLGLLKFLPYFVWESVLGGIDVASRVVRPKMRIAPGFIEYRSRLTHVSARRLFVNSLSLLPGTLAADLDGACVRIHALDLRMDLNQQMEQLERRIAAVYGETL
ncbi:MAG: Na+/H+ antiporter subunit E [Candidatus Thiodiazotropha sp.]